MRDPFESLIPLNGCKGTTFFLIHQTFCRFFLNDYPHTPDRIIRMLPTGCFCQCRGRPRASPHCHQSFPVVIAPRGIGLAQNTAGDTFVPPAAINIL